MVGGVGGWCGTSEGSSGRDCGVLGLALFVIYPRDSQSQYIAMTQDCRTIYLPGDYMRCTYQMVYSLGPLYLPHLLVLQYRGDPIIKHCTKLVAKWVLVREPQVPIVTYAR